MTIGRFTIVWKGLKGELIGWGWRLNPGGFMYGTEPYYYLNFGPFHFRYYQKMTTKHTPEE